MSAADLSGWAIRRNGSCLISREVDCGGTRAPYRACCPSSTECPAQYNVACCPSNTNCTAAIAEVPRCANSSWVMYDNAGYFCCEAGQVGYNIDNTDGCSRSGASIPDGAVPLAAIAQASLSSAISSTTAPITASSGTTSATPSVTPSQSPESGSSSSSTIPVGAIVGGVVGGVAFIAIVLAGIFFLRRRRRSGDAQPGASEKDATTAAPDRTEIDSNPRAELSTAGAVRTYELP